jgi:hypothetical protein
VVRVPYDADWTTIVESFPSVFGPQRSGR